jgi:hypothetical protein
MRRGKLRREREAEARRREADLDAQIIARLTELIDRAKAAGMTTEEIDALKDELQAPETDGGEA